MKHLLTIVAALVLAATVNAQQGAQSKPQPAPAPAPALPPPGASAVSDTFVNIRYEITIREEGGPQAQPTMKVVSMTSTLHETALVRAGGARNPLNVDATPTGIEGSKVRTKLGIEYTPQTPAVPAGGAPLPTLSVRQNVSVWLESGKSMVISQASDPLSDRRLTVIATATVIR